MSITKVCRVKKGFLPNITPIISSLSTYTSESGKYKVIYVACNKFNFNTTSVTFSNAIFKSSIPVIYFSTFSISFVVPINAPIGIYNIQVLIIDESRLSPNIVYSNIISYTLT